MYKLNKKRGFTLIELIMVMGIFAILVLLLVPKIMKCVSKANDIEIVSNSELSPTYQEVEVGEFLLYGVKTFLS